MRTVADDRKRRVVAHGSHWLLGGGGHRDDGAFDVFLPEAEVHQFAVIIAHAVIHMPATLQFLQLHAILIQPFAIGMGFRQLFLDFTVVINLTLLSVDEQDFSRLQTTFAHDVSWFEIHHAHLAGHHHHTILGDGVTAWAQSVSVEHSACVASVAEQQCGGTVPRFHKNGVILVESLQVLTDGVLVVETLRNENGHRLWQ